MNVILLHCKSFFFEKVFLFVPRATALFDFAHPWAQPSGRPSFGIRPIRLSLPNCGCGPLTALWNKFGFLSITLELRGSTKKCGKSKIGGVSLQKLITDKFCHVKCDLMELLLYKGSSHFFIKLRADISFEFCKNTFLF